MTNMLKEPYSLYHNERYLENEGCVNQEDAKYLLTTLSNVFEQNGIQLMLAYGTLLGAIREHNFIAHDTDIDVMIFAKDRDKALSLQEELKKYGIELWCYVLPWIFTFKYKTVTCDVDVLYEANKPWNKQFYLLLEKYIPKSYFQRVEKIDFLGQKFYAPANPENLLEYHYGKKWRIPSSRHARIESYLFFWRYFHRFIQKIIRHIKRKFSKQ